MSRLDLDTLKLKSCLVNKKRLFSIGSVGFCLEKYTAGIFIT